MTLTFKLVRARDQTHLACEFGANPFSGSGDISQTKISQTVPKQNLMQFTAYGNDKYRNQESNVA